MPASRSTAPPVVIAGTGHGCRVHAQALRSAGFQVAGLVGSDPERTRRRAERHGIPHADTDLDTAIAATGAVAVVVATPPAHHARGVRTALARGCHVLCEKPFTLDAAEARALRMEADSAGIIHLLGNQFRILPDRRMVGEAIAAGLLGEPRMASTLQYNALLADTRAPKPDWWFSTAQGGGWLGASGSHAIDQAQHWLGPITQVSAALPLVADRDISVAEDSFLIRYQTGGGTHGVLQQTGGAWGPTTSLTRIAGTRGSVWLESGETWVADAEGTRRLDIPDALQLPHIPPSGKPGEQYRHIELPPSTRLAELWRKAIDGDADALAPCATFADGLACMEVIDAVRESAARGGEAVRVTRC